MRIQSFSRLPRRRDFIQLNNTIYSHDSSSLYSMPQTIYEYALSDDAFCEITTTIQTIRRITIGPKFTSRIIRHIYYIILLLLPLLAQYISSLIYSNCHSFPVAIKCINCLLCIHYRFRVKITIFSNIRVGVGVMVHRTSKRAIIPY
jgi:hypothetical protein